MAPGLTQLRLGELPVEITGFVGRRSELAKLSTLLRSARLVTVTGPGGVGKTRCALRAAARLTDRFTDGVYLAELAGLRDPELLPHTIATALGLPEQDTRLPTDAVLDYLRGRQVLLILDTCEHLVDACAVLTSTLLRGTENVTVLVTSRQPLDVAGERICRIPPLPVPPFDATEAGRGDAVELFAQRAADAVPGFAVTDANRADVIRLCWWLDGIPLAIELATVRLRAVSLDQLAGRLEDRFLLLTGERRDALPHHQTLRTATQWSYDLCTAGQQLLWARLSVFAGSFSIADAEQVCADGTAFSQVDVVRALIDLVDKSVVAQVGDRYRQLDTIREFGAEKLAESGEENAVRRRHVARYVAMARYFGADPIGEDQVERYRELRAEHDNLRAALDYAFADGDLDAEAASLAADLYGYWQISGLLGEGRRWIAKALDRFPGPSAERAWALVMSGILATLQGEIPDAFAVLDEGIPMAEDLGEALSAARGYGHRTLASGVAGLHEQAMRAGATAAERAEAIADAPGLAALDVEMALVYSSMGEPQLAIARCAQGLARFRPGSRERWMQGWLNCYTGLGQFLLGSLDDSAATLRTALAMKYELGDSVGMAYCLETLGWVAAAWGRHDRTAWLLGAADALWDRVGRRLSGDAALEQFRQQAALSAGDGLGAARYATLYNRGTRDSLDHVIALAGGDEDAVVAAAATTTRKRAGQAPPKAAADTPDAHAALSQLTSRQRQIAWLVAEGLSNREIAERLVISKRTVDTHIDHIFGRLGVSSRMQLAAWLASSHG
ncbi:MAG TPA: LuxR C-terminal-related transcriptional regulator [Streptosporangiaceae bacterium]